MQLSSTGLAHVQAISSPQSYLNGSPSASRGYTTNHFRFPEEVEWFQRKASSSAASGLVTVKVVLLRQVAKGAKIVPVVVDAVCWFPIEGY